MSNTINIILPAMTMGAGSPAQSYFASARGLYPGVELLANSSSQVVRACAFLAAQTLECALKSYLSHAGFSEAKLKQHSRRHNLETLWLEASNHGLKISAKPPNWCSILNSAHDKPYYLRYPIGINAVVFPELKQMVSDLKNLLAKVETAIQNP